MSNSIQLDQEQDYDSHINPQWIPVSVWLFALLIFILIQPVKKDEGEDDNERFK